MRIEIYGSMFNEQTLGCLNFLESHNISYTFKNTFEMNIEEVRDILIEVHKINPNIKPPFIFIEGKIMDGIDEFKEYFE